MICSATAGIMFVIMGIAATSERHIKSLRSSVWLARLAIRGTRSRPGAIRATNHDSSASSCFAPLLCRPNGATPHQSTRASPHRGDLDQFNLLSQCFFKALLCFCRERCLRDFADFFGKLARDFAHVIELLRVALAK